MNATAGMIAGLHDSCRKVESIIARRDPGRRRELIDIRRIMIGQLWALKHHAAGPECRVDPALSRELAKRISVIWADVALVQASWPASSLDQYATEHYAATRKLKAAYDDFFRWANKYIGAAPSGFPLLPDKVS